MVAGRRDSEARGPLISYAHGHAVVSHILSWRLQPGTPARGGSAFGCRTRSEWMKRVLLAFAGSLIPALGVGAGMMCVQVVETSTPSPGASLSLRPRRHRAGGCARWMWIGGVRCTATPRVKAQRGSAARRGTLYPRLPESESWNDIDIAQVGVRGGGWRGPVCGYARASVVGGRRLWGGNFGPRHSHNQ
jgi:hypothetical protein